MEFGLFEVDAASRRVQGILVPHEEMSRVSQSGNQPMKFKSGAVKLPRDPAVVSLNRMHDRFDPLGYAVTLEPREQGVFAVLEVANTDEGDAWLADHAGLVRLSPELRDIVRDADGYATATLTGAALVDEGAFASAGLFAIGAVENVLEVEPDEEDENPDVVPSVNEETSDEAPAAPDTEPDGEPDDTKEDAVGTATATEVMLAGRGGTSTDAPKGVTKRGFFRMIDDVMGGRASAETRRFVAENLGPGESGMFALSDVDYDGSGGVGAKMTPAQWIGEVESLQYISRWADLFPTEALSSLSLGGWKWGVKPTGGTWTGNKDAIPSNTPTVVPVTDSATRWAGGHDIAREHRDFGTPGFFESYNAAMRESYEEWKDTTIVRTEVVAGATDIEADDPSGLTIGAGWSALIDGAAAVVAAGFTPTFANIELSLWKSMMKVPSSDTLGYLEAALNLEEGSLSGFVFRPVTGIATGHIIVGSRQAATVFELPGVPIRAEAQNIANGGIDVGHFGYAGLLIRNALGIVDVAPYTP